jgi:hypothetical protein
MLACAAIAALKDILEINERPLVGLDHRVRKQVLG